MKIRGGFDWWHWQKPFYFGHDDLCNRTINFAVPFVGWVTLFSTKRKHTDGLWTTTSGLSNKTLHIYSYSPEDRHMIAAEIDVESIEVGEAFLGDDCPKIWTDEEIKNLDVHFYECTESGYEHYITAYRAFMLLERPLTEHITRSIHS